MITGIVTANEDAVIRLLVRGAGSILHEVEAVVDTGFNGYLSLPAALVTALGLPYLRTERTILANGSIEDCAVHEVTVLWDEQERAVLVQATEGDALIGMAMMHDYKLTIEVKGNGNVLLEALS